MTLLVFGTNGQVATELRAQAGPRRMIALSRAEADLSDPGTCAAQILRHEPSAVINAAAYTAVDRAEQEEDLALTINGKAPGTMAQACANERLPFLHISTDYVFAGTGEMPHRPDDPVDPQNAYGRTKLAGEEAVRAAGGAHAILRTSWVFSEHGNNFVKTMLRLSETRGALSIVEDQMGGPTPAAGIASALLTICDAMLSGHKGGTYHYAGAPATSWKCFACETFAQAGRQVDVTGILTADYPTPAKRPLNSRLDCASTETDFGISQPSWKDALTRSLKVLV